MQVIQNIAALKAVNGTTVSDGYVKLLGYYTAADGGGGDFYWNNTSTQADNGGTVFQAIGVATGRWIRLYTGAVHVKWFGAKCNNATDDSDAIQASLNSSIEVILDGISFITKTIKVAEGQTFSGVSTLLSGLHTKSNIDILQVFAFGTTIKDMMLSTQYSSVDDNHAMIRLTPTNTQYIWGERPVFNNLFLSGNTNLTGIGISLEVVGPFVNKYNYLTFASFTDISIAFVDTAIKISNLGEVVGTNINFVNSNVFDGIFIYNSNNAININTDGTLTQQVNGTKQISKNVFQNIFIQYNGAATNTGIVLNGGSENYFKAFHFDPAASMPLVNFSNTSYNNLIEDIGTTRNKVTNPDLNHILFDSIVLSKGKFNGSDGSIIDGFNIQSITRTDVGKYRINFTHALPNNSYKIFLDSNLLNLQKTLNNCFIINDKSTTGFSIYGWIINENTSTNYHDLGQVDFIVYS